MLVHTVTDNRLSVHNSHVAEITKDIKNWENINSGNEFISTSLISDKFMAVYGYSNPSDIKVIFGFCNLEDDSVRFNSIKDAGVERKTSKDAEFTVKDAFNKEVYTLTTVDDLMTKTIEYNKYIYPENREWNEVIISRKSGTTGKKITPDFVVCMDTINQTSIEAAKYFNIPIYLIHRKAYKDLPYIEEKKDNKTEFDSTDVEHKVR